MCNVLKLIVMLDMWHRLSLRFMLFVRLLCHAMALTVDRPHRCRVERSAQFISYVLFPPDKYDPFRWMADPFAPFDCVIHKSNRYARIISCGAANIPDTFVNHSFAISIGAALPTVRAIPAHADVPVCGLNLHPDVQTLQYKPFVTRRFARPAGMVIRLRRTKLSPASLINAMNTSV